MRNFLAPGSPPLFRPLSCLGLAASLCAVIYGCGGQASARRLRPPLGQPLTAHEIEHTRVTVASWYGPGFHGHPTSSGEIYNQQAMTAASRTLPLGSHAKVTNLTTGKSVVVRINDRGPYVRGRGIDLSRAAACRLGIEGRGIATVRVTRIDGPSGEVGNSWAGRVNIRDAPRVTPVDYASRSNPSVAESSIIPSSVGSYLMQLISPSR
jgi:rare lipoprotein A (peptidoglycan hydrolase)